MPSDIVRAVHSRELKVKLRSDGGVLRLIICSLSLTSVVSCLSFLSVTDLEDRSPSLQLYRLLFTDICKVNSSQKQ